MIINIWVQPNAKTNKVSGMYGDKVKVLITAKAVDNEANEALVEFLSQHYKVKKSQVKIIKGFKSRNKLIEINE